MVFFQSSNFSLKLLLLKWDKDLLQYSGTESVPGCTGNSKGTGSGTGKKKMKSTATGTGTRTGR